MNKKAIIVIFLCLVVPQIANGESRKGLPIPFNNFSWLDESVSDFMAKDFDLAPPTTCRKMNSMFAGSDLTDLQKKREWKKYKGKMMPLTGKVFEVDNIPLSYDYIAAFKCLNSDSLASDFTVRIPSHKSDYAYSLNNSEQHTIGLLLYDYSGLSGIKTKLDSMNIPENKYIDCKPTLSSVKRNPTEVKFSCDEEKFYLRHISLGNSDKPFNAYEGFIRFPERELGVIKIKELNSSTIYLSQKKDNSSFSFYDSAGENCSATINLTEENRGRYEEIIKTHMPDNVEAMTFSESYSAFVKNYLAGKTNISCTNEQLVRALSFMALGNQYIKY